MVGDNYASFFIHMFVRNISYMAGIMPDCTIQNAFVIGETVSENACVEYVLDALLSGC